MMIATKIVPIVSLLWLVCCSCEVWTTRNTVFAFVPTITSVSRSSSNSNHPFLFYTNDSRSRSSKVGVRLQEKEKEELEEKVNELKRVLNREYVTFFDPMQRDYYSSNVTFEDPMTSLDSIDAYQTNVDMLASRTWLGKFLFADAGISLHTITGGQIIPTSNTDETKLSISDIQTRWTLRLTAKVFPWKPTARFTGISLYQVVPTHNNNNNNNNVGVKIVGQKDYWDSINIQPNSNGQYQTVDKSVAIGDFLNQLKPGGFQAKTAAPELPYQLLRRGNGYEVRKYPSFVGVKLPYKRRDEGFGSLGAFTRGMEPLSPALMEVQNQDTSDKYMIWPLSYTQPGQKTPQIPMEAAEKAGTGQWRTIQLISMPERVVAIGEFTDASMEPVVRKADRELRANLARDGLLPLQGTQQMVRFAQYDAIFSMGKRRGEVWIDLDDANNGHPW